jgi:hypothetical protein
VLTRSAPTAGGAALADHAQQHVGVARLVQGTSGPGHARAYGSLAARHLHRASPRFMDPQANAVLNRDLAKVIEPIDERGHADPELPGEG